MSDKQNSTDRTKILEFTAAHDVVSLLAISSILAPNLVYFSNGGPSSDSDSDSYDPEPESISPRYHVVGVPPDLPDFILARKMILLKGKKKRQIVK